MTGFGSEDNGEKNLQSGKIFGYGSFSIFPCNVQYYNMKNKKSTWMKICNTMTPFCSLVVAFEEFFNGRFLSGIGWFSASFAWWALFKEEKAFDELYEMFLNRLDIDLQMTKAYIGKLKEYEGDKLSGTTCVQNGSRN